MKLIINRTEAVDALKNLARVAKSSKLPVTQCVHIEAHQNGQLLLAATNLEQWLSIEATALEVKTPGSVCVDATLLLRLMEGGDDDATLAIEGNQLAVTTGEYTANLNTLPVEEFPPLIDLKDEQEFSINSDTLRAGINSVIHAASVDDARPTLCSVALVIKSGAAALAAFRGSIAGVAELAEGFKLKDATYIIPTDAAALISRTLPQDASVKVKLYGAPTNPVAVLVHFAGHTIVTKLIEGSYKDPRELLNITDDMPLFCVDTSALRHAIDRVSVFVGEFGSVRFSVPDGVMVMETENPDSGKIKIEVPCQYSGEERLFAINPAFLSSALRADGPDKLEMALEEINVQQKSGPDFIQKKIIFTGKSATHAIACIAV